MYRHSDRRDPKSCQRHPTILSLVLALPILGVQVIMVARLWVNFLFWQQSAYISNLDGLDALRESKLLARSKRRPAQVDPPSLARRFARLPLDPDRAWIERRRGNSFDLAEIAEPFDFVSGRNNENVAGSEHAKSCRCPVNRQHGHQQLSAGTAAANSRHCVCSALFGYAR